MIEGLQNRNRALNGDVIVCILLPTPSANKEQTVQNAPNLLPVTPKKPDLPQKLKENVLKVSDNKAYAETELTTVPEQIKQTKPKNKKKKKVVQAVLNDNQESLEAPSNSQDIESPHSNIENVDTVRHVTRKSTCALFLLSVSLNNFFF